MNFLSAQRGDAEAQYILAYSYYYGYGVEKDIHKPLSFYEKSFANGSQDAAEKIKIIKAIM